MVSEPKVDCLFCKIVGVEIPVQKAFETPEALAFPDINPQAPIHYLIIPKTHTPCVAETDSDVLLGQVLGAARFLAHQLNLSDYRLVINNGEKAGQSVFHLHVHLLSGRDFQWPPG
ncbi:MAG: HIT domain-containing protein [Cyanobacteria bacterium]|nr:HIT domain-containing protein [Cyanobacteriota bacterium]